MRVAIVGAGALGSVYGARLSTLADCDVRLVARQARPAMQVVLERVDAAEAIRWSAPAATIEAPADTDVILACVRYEQLSSLQAKLGASRAPVVVLTPMMPADHRRLDAAIATRLVTGMPSVIAYRNDPGVIRYWLPRMGTTWIEARGDAAEGTLVRRLERAGIAAQLESGVLARNVATTASLLPIAFALDIAGSVESAVDDTELLKLTLEGLEEGRDLARTIGRPAAWAAALAPLLRPVALRVGLTVARSRAPEAIRYAQEHFGRKLHTQNVALGEAVLALAQERGARRVALAELVRRVRGRAVEPS
jgi:2-dehydropantoate 2-reductase